MTTNRAPRALITGASGFVGRWLASALVRAGWEVTGTATARPDADAMQSLTRRPEWAEMREVEWIVGDVRDGAHLAAAIDRARPDAIIPLAAVSSVPLAASDPAMAWDVNVISTVRLLHAVDQRRAAGTIDPVVLVVGSSEQYGRHDLSDVPLREEHELRPRTVYGATKAAQEVAALQAHRASGVRVVAVRPFIHTGPGQEPRFLLPALIARAVQLRTADAGTPLLMGNSSPQRDFLHVRDVVSAYISLLATGEPGGVYNVASGAGQSIRDVAARVLHCVGVQAPIAEDPALVRAVDVPALVGDSSRLTALTGWTPTYTLDDIILDLLDDLRHAATH